MFLKKIAAFSAALAILFSSYAYGSSLYTIYDLSQETRLSTGITYERIEKFTSNGWININVVRANLTDEYTKVKPITSEKGVSNRAPLSSMIKSSGATAAVNGDFFYMGDPTYTYGPLIDNGKLITSPLPFSSGYPTVSKLVEGKNIDISVWNPKITLYGSDSTEYNVIVLNKTSSLDWGPTILTSDWNTTSPGYDGKKDIVEVVVVENTVTEIRKNQPSTIIPEKGYVIASRNATTMEKMLNSFIPGQAATLNIELDFSPENVEWAFGALNYLVKDGQLNEISDEALGSHPRTAIGFTKDNSEMIMVTIDGRNKNYIGVKQTELAQIMLDLGAYNAVNMDGGGSTTMGIDFLRNSNVKVVNFPSDGGERKIASGVGVFNTSPISNKVNTIEIIPEQEQVFNNTEVKLNLKFFNEYKTQIESTDKVNYEVSPKDAGKVVNNVFFPSKAGKVVITAKQGTGEGQVEIEVLDYPVALKFSIDSLTMGFNENYEIGNILGIDKHGNSAYIPAQYINYTYRNKIGKVENGVFTSGDVSNTGAITASFGDAVKHIPVKVGYRYETLHRFEDLDNLRLKLYPENSDGNISISKDFVKEGSASLKLDYDFTKMTDQSIAFVEFGKDGEGIKLEGKPKAIGMWVYGDGKNHWLRTRITDAYNNQIKITFEDEVNWHGWKWVEAHIPEGTAYPVTLKNIYLAEINETRQDSGTIYVDNLRIMYEPKDKNLGLRPETEFIDSMKTTSISDFSEKLTVEENLKKITGENNKIVYYDAIITNGTMSPSNTTMWNNIKSMPNYKDKVLVLTMNASFDHIYDEREVKVLKEILEKASENNEVFVVYKGVEEKTVIENKIRYIVYDDSFELGITDSGIKYKN